MSLWSLDIKKALEFLTNFLLGKYKLHIIRLCVVGKFHLVFTDSVRNEMCPF